MLFDRLEIAIDENGNFITQNGDLTAHSSIDSLRKLILWRLQTTKEEWGQFNPLIAVGVERFMGRPNQRDTAEEMSLAIKSALVADGLVPIGDLFVDVVPISYQAVTILVQIRNLITLDNTGDTFQFTFNYDFPNGKIISIDGSVR